MLLVEYMYVDAVLYLRLLIHIVGDVHQPLHVAVDPLAIQKAIEGAPAAQVAAQAGFQTIVVEANQELLDRDVPREFYSTEEFARLVGKAPVTVRDGCPFGHIAGTSW